MAIQTFPSVRACLILLVAILGPCYLSSSGLAQVDFAKQVQPLLKRSCYHCHSGAKPESGYRLDMRDRALLPGDSGELALVPGKAATSPLMQYVRGEKDGLKMPPEDSDVQGWTQTEIELVAQWIDEGAEWPAGLDADQPTTSMHWSLQPLASSLPPDCSQTSSPSQVIDTWLERKQHELSLQTTELADRRTLIRRITFDLIGLPPTPREIEEFLLDSAPTRMRRSSTVCSLHLTMVNVGGGIGWMWRVTRRARASNTITFVKMPGHTATT